MVKIEKDITNDFLEKLRKECVSLEFTPNGGANNMYTMNETYDKETIPRGGVILGKEGQIGSRYYSYDDILKALDDFRAQLEVNNSNEKNDSEKQHEVSSVSKTVDTKAFIESIKNGLKIYIEPNPKLKYQDARVVSMDVKDDSKSIKKNKGGMIAPKGQSEIKDGTYIDENDIKIAVNEVISQMPITTDKKPESVIPEKKHKVTANKGKSKNKNLKKALIILCAAMLLTLKGCTLANQQQVDMSQEPTTYVDQINYTDSKITRQISLDIDSAFEDGLGSIFEAEDSLKYGADTREELDVSTGNFVKTGDECTVDGISINDEKTGEIVYSIYDPEGEKGNLDIHDFIENYGPKQGGNYRVFVHIKNSQDGRNTRLGWVNAGRAVDSGEKVELINKTEYVVVQVENGGIKDFEVTKRVPEGTLSIKAAPKNIIEETENKIDNIKTSYSKSSQSYDER